LPAIYTQPFPDGPYWRSAVRKVRGPPIRALLPPGDTGVLASAGSVSCAVHAKGKTALEVAEEIARAASARLPGDPQDLAPAIREALSGRPGSRFSVIIDALDEAAGPAQTRAIIDAVVLPLAETCADAGAQVVVGTRRHDDGGDILRRFVSCPAFSGQGILRLFTRLPAFPAARP